MTTLLTVMISGTVFCTPQNYPHSDCQIEDLYYLEVTACEYGGKEVKMAEK